MTPLVVGMWVEVLECVMGHAAHVGLVGQVTLDDGELMVRHRCKPNRHRQLGAEEVAMFLLARGGKGDRR